MVRREDNPNGAWAKSRRERVVPLDFLTVQAFDTYEFERVWGVASHQRTHRGARSGRGLIPDGGAQFHPAEPPTRPVTGCGRAPSADEPAARSAGRPICRRLTCDVGLASDPAARPVP